MNGGLIPYRYARALYKLALEHGNTEVVYDEMKNVVNSFERNSEFRNVLANPFVSNIDKQKLLETAAGSSIEDDYRGFIRLILQNKREAYAYEMALAYRDIFRKANNISTVRIATAIKMPEEEISKLRTLIVNAFPGRTLEFTEVVDDRIIGGFVIDVDQVRMDASLSNEIEKLRLKLLSTK